MPVVVASVTMGGEAGPAPLARFDAGPAAAATGAVTLNAMSDRVAVAAAKVVDVSGIVIAAIGTGTP